MPTSPQSTGAYRMLRNARLSSLLQAQAATLGAESDEALSVLIFHLSGSDSDPLIRPAGDITAESSAQIANDLLLRIRHGILNHLPQETEDADFLTLWDSVEAVAHALALHGPVEALGAEAANIASKIAAEMRTLPGSEMLDVGGDFSGRVTDFLRDWSSEAIGMNEGGARLLFLSRLVRQVLATSEAPASVWEMFLLKLELAVASPSSDPQLARLLAPVFRVAWSSLSLMPPLHAFWKLNASRSSGDVAACERITTLALIERAGGRHAARLRSAVSPSWIAVAADSTLWSSGARWRSLLAANLELAAYQPLLNAADQCGRLLEIALALPGGIQGQAQSLRRMADDLAQGMPGRDTPDQLAKLASDLLEHALWISSLGGNPAETRSLFLSRIVRELGLDPSSPIWKKHSRLVSSLQQVAATGAAPLPWKDAVVLLRAVDARATEIKQLPIRWSTTVPPYAFEGVPFSGGDGPERCARDTSLLLSRIAIEHRVHGTVEGDREVLRWYAEEVLPHLHHVPDASFRERWDLLCETGFSSSPEHAHLNRLARRFGSGLPVLTAAWKLDMHAEAIAEMVADEVLAEIPDYARKIGPAGRISCVRDNALTFRQVASLLLSDSESTAETLAEWWNSAVGSYLATRPARLFETNLNAIFHAFSAKLDAVELKAAFSPIQQVYRESLGIECLESLAGSPTASTGPLLRKLSAGVRIPDADRETLRGVLAKSLAARNASRCTESLLTAFLAFHYERWNGAGEDAAASRCLGALATEPLAGSGETCAAALIECLSEAGAADAAAAFLLQESAHEFVMAIGQASLARALGEHASSIAEAYAGAMVAFAPAHFEKLGRAESTARCRRDQTLLLRKLGDLLAQSSPCLFWVDATRWYLELLAPFIDYPAPIWALSARTVAKHLGSRLSAPGRLFLARWVSQFEHLAHGWASCPALARHAFKPTDYSFSAKPEEDRVQRDLLAACIASASAPRKGAWCTSAIMMRFLLVWPGSLRDEAELTRTLANISQVGGGRIPPAAASLLRSVPARLARLAAASAPHTLGRLAGATDLPSLRESARALDLASGKTPAEWTRVRGASDTGVPAPLAQAALRAHLLHTPEPDHRRALASAFPQAVRDRVARVAACMGTRTTSASWMALVPSIEAVSSDANSLRSHMTTLSLDWDAVQAGLDLAQKADDHAATLLEGLAGSGDVAYSTPKDVPCDAGTNRLSFAYAFRQTGSAVWDTAAEPPRLFFGSAADNHRLLPVAVAANAHTRIFRALAEQLPLGSGLTGTALLGIEADVFPSTPQLWMDLAEGGSPAAHVSELFQAIRPLADSAAAYACGNDSAARQSLSHRLRHHLEALVCALHESGDIEAAWELLLHRLAPDLDSQEPDRLVSAFYGLTREAGGLQPGTAMFLRTVLSLTVDVVRQAVVGRCLLRGAREFAEAYAASVFQQAGGPRSKCVRDQQHLLLVLGHLLCTQAPLRAWLNFSSSFVELTLPHISEGAGELAAMWTRHETAISRKLPLSVRPALWAWTGALQRMSRNLPAVRALAGTVAPGLAPKLAASRGGVPSDWRRLLCALAASAATPDDGPAPGSALVEKLLLCTPLHQGRSLGEWVQISDQIGSEVEALLPGRVPNSFRRRLNAFSETASRCAALVSARGSRLVRMCSIQASHPASRPLWMASMLARARPSDRMVESDPCDTAASKALGVPLEQDDAVIARLDQLRAAAGLPARLSLQPRKQGGLLSMIGLSRKGFDWASSAGLKSEAGYVVDELALRTVTGFGDPSLAWFWSCPGTLATLDPEKEEGVLEFYDVLASAVRDTLGNAHPVVPALEAFSRQLRSRITGLRLSSSESVPHSLVPLALLGVRSPADVPAYPRMEDNDASRFLQILPKAGKEASQAAERLVLETLEGLRRASV